MTVPSDANVDTATSEPRRHRLPVLSIVVAVVCWLLVAIGAFSLVARNVVSSWHPFILAAVAVPITTVLVLLAAAGFGLGRRWLPMALALVVFLSLAGPQARVLLRPTPHADGTRLTVMTFNMRLGDADGDQVLAAARSHGVQLLMLQEISRPALARLQAAGIDRQFAYNFQNARGGGSGIALFSVFPLSHTVNHPDFLLQVISATVTLPDGQALTAFSSHLSAPWPQDAKDWVADSRRLGPVLAATRGAVVDAGDFNSTVNFKAFRQLLSRGGMTDAAESAGVTLRTYPADRSFPPLFGIDHVLLRQVRATGLDTVRIADSDHRAVVARLVLG